MKKSFMTRVLATGLSFAMAFSMAAATNVSVASAAATPAMASKQFVVRVGGDAKSYKASAATQKSFKISKATVGNTAKATVKVNSTKKSIKVTPGTVTGSTVVTIKFLNTKTKKYTTKKYRCVVKAAKEEKLTMTAAATKVKQITVTFNKAVEDTAAAKLTVKKSTATPAVSEVKFDETKKVATLAMAGKLTKGTYTVTAVVGDETLTADAVVEKDETLTTFKLVGNTLKAASATNTTKAAIEYQALNQYEEPMSGANPTVTIAPGTTKTSECTIPTKDKNGKAVVEDIPATYAIPGMEFTILIVDSTGKTLQDKVVYGATAKAAKATSVGLYNTSKAKFMDMTAGDKVSDYVALFTVVDQYDDAYTPQIGDAASNGISAVALGGLTNVKAKAFTAGSAPIKEVGGKKYLCVGLEGLDNGPTGIAVAGDFTLSLVNGQYGAMGDFPYTILPNTEVKTLSISSDVIYAGQKNTMTFTATDVNGNEITKYDVLKNVTFTEPSTNGRMKFEKNADGTAKLVYDATSVSVPLGAKTTVESFTATANKVVSPNYFVQTYTFTISTKRVPTAVVGVNAKFAKSTAASGNAIALNFNKLLIEDQYGNLFTEDELKAGSLVSTAAVVISGDAFVASNAGITSNAAWTVSGAAFANHNSTFATGAAFNAAGGKVDIVSPTTTGAITTKFRFYILKDGKLNTDPYTLTMNKVADSDKKKITNIEIESIADGKMVKVQALSGDAMTANVQDNAAKASGTGTGTVTVPVVVTAKVGEDKIILGSDQVDAYITCAPIKPWYTVNDNQTETATMTVKVATADGTVTVTKEFQVSNTPATAAKLAVKSGYDGTVNVVPASSGVLISSLSGTAFTVTDQYGNAFTPGKSALYTIAVTKVTTGGSINGTDITKDAKEGTNGQYVLTNADGMNTAKITVNDSAVCVLAKVTVTIGDMTVTFDQVFDGN